MVRYLYYFSIHKTNNFQMLGIRNLFIGICLILQFAFSLDITSDRVDRGTIDIGLGDTTIHSGASWSIINNAITALAGSLTVESDAGFYITLTSPLIGLDVTLLAAFGSIVNDGIVAFNSVASLFSSDYDLRGTSFTNNGEMYLGASGLLLSSMSINSVEWHNNGLLVFYQNQRFGGSLSLGPLLGGLSPMMELFA